ncbi:MAG TPA: LuxR C-terminal-related transcriptional regulator [Acidocella sp.]|nr:LuxR C-terminal-related transcriptional regulator [Acidocella sp.]
MRSPYGQIDRERLAPVRDAAARARLVTLTAPGGYGKTSLAAAWAAHWQQQGGRCAWLSLERDDDVPARFLFGLTQALRGLGPGIGDAAQAVLAGASLAAPRAVMSMLIDDLEHIEDETFLVLDDYQWIHDASIHDAVAFLLLHAPVHLHLVITSRTRPELPLARLRALGQWLELDVTDLRFDEDETRRFLQATSPQALTAEQARHLHAHTDGWVAALRIAALGTSGAGGADVQVSGASRAFAHLIEDMLESLPSATVLFMARTSVLDYLNAGLCEAVTGAPDSAALLEQMTQSYLLVEPLDGEGSWLRYHQLLLDYLRGPLTQRLGIEPRELHRRAASWFAGQAMWTDAVRHALAAGDNAQALEWLVHCGMALVKKGDLMTLLAWRRAFPPELMRKQPGVQVAVAWGLTLAMRYGDAEPVLNEVEQDETSGASPGVLAQCQAVRAVAAALQDDSCRALQLAESWQTRQSVTDAWTGNVISNVMRFAYWKAGRWADVYEQPWVPYSLEDDARNVFSTVYREILLGYVELEQARLGVAGRHAREALRLAELHNGPRSVAAALAAPLGAMITYEQGRSEAAEAALTPLLPLIDNTAMLESVLQTYLVLARIARGRGDPGHAYGLLEHAESIGYNRGWDRLVSVMLLERLRWLAADGRFDEAHACGVRLGRLALTHTGTQRCARSDLATYRDWGQAHLALFDQRAADAVSGFARLYAEARALRYEYRSLSLGVSLALAHMACDDRDSAFSVLHDVLQGAQRSGASRSILDYGADIWAMLSRFLVSEQRDPALVPYVQRLLADQGETAPKPAEGAANVLTDRERRVLVLVALGQSNKEVARELNISAETVKTHLKNIFVKLDVQQRWQAVALARALGLLEDG